MSEPKIIQRRENEKLWDQACDSYVTALEVASMISSGVRVQVIDAATSEDITGAVLKTHILNHHAHANDGAAEKTVGRAKEIIETAVKVPGRVSDQFDILTGKKILEEVQKRLANQDKYNDVLATKLVEALERIKILEHRLRMDE